MTRIVCYLLTRNIYLNVIPSLKSLLKNGNVDQVWLLIEDEDIGYELPDDVVVYNIGRFRERYFRSNGPNYYSRWSYMVMMKTVLCKIFPWSRVLTLDVDTIVQDDISALWDLPIDDYYLAGAREPHKTIECGHDYVNCGVLLWNLNRMRDGAADKLVTALNQKKYDFCEQDCINELLSGQIMLMDRAYNC